MDFYYKEYAGKDVDIVLTTREFTRMLRGNPPPAGSAD